MSTPRSRFRVRAAEGARRRQDLNRGWRRGKALLLWRSRRLLTRRTSWRAPRLLEELAAYRTTTFQPPRPSRATLYLNHRQSRQVLPEHSMEFSASDKSYFNRRHGIGLAPWRVSESIEFDNLVLSLESHGRPHYVTVRIRRRTSAEDKPSPPASHAVKRGRDLIE